MQGYSGKMGSIVYNYLKEKGHTFLALLDENNLNLTNEEMKNCDTIIDFSCPKASLKIFDMATKCHKPMIIGTTGFTKEQEDYIKEESIKNGISVYLVANFLENMQILKDAITKLGNEAKTIYLDERHHKSKKDQPSGTAKFLISELDKSKVTVISKRLDYYVYEHHIEINNEFETIEITHKCYNKLGYAKGVEKALKSLNTFKGVKCHI